MFSTALPDYLIVIRVVSDSHMHIIILSTHTFSLSPLQTHTHTHTLSLSLSLSLHSTQLFLITITRCYLYYHCSSVVRRGDGVESLLTSCVPADQSTSIINSTTFTHDVTYSCNVIIATQNKLTRSWSV